MNDTELEKRFKKFSWKFSKKGKFFGFHGYFGIVKPPDGILSRFYNTRAAVNDHKIFRLRSKKVIMQSF